MSQLKLEHDRLLAEMPDGATHEADKCFFCTPDNNPSQGGDMKTYTEDDFTAAVQEAVAPIKAELEALRTSHAESEVEARIAAIQAEADEKLVELQTAVDAQESRANELQKANEDLIAYLAAEAQALEEASLLVARKEARKAAVNEVASFTEEQIEAKLDRWAAMSDEAWEEYLDDLKAISTASLDDKTKGAGANLVTGLPVDTAMNHTRTPGNTTPAFVSLYEMLGKGVDPRTL